MVRRKNRKGAVEMSLNLIIMLIIGMVIMGLIISFVTSFLGNAEEKFQGKLTEDDKNNIEQVKREQGNFAFLTSTVEVEQGSNIPGKLYAKIRNSESEDLEYNSNGGDIATSSSDILSVKISPGKISGTYDSGITIWSPGFVLASGDMDGYAFEVYADKVVPLGTYYAKFTLSSSVSNVKYNKVVTINVK